MRPRGWRQLLPLFHVKRRMRLEQRQPATRGTVWHSRSTRNPWLLSVQYPSTGTASVQSAKFASTRVLGVILMGVSTKGFTALSSAQLRNRDAQPRPSWSFDNRRDRLPTWGSIWLRAVWARGVQITDCLRCRLVRAAGCSRAKLLRPRAPWVSSMLGRS